MIKKQIGLFVGIAAWLVLTGIALSGAAQADVAPISQGFQAKGNFPIGALVSLNTNNLSEVVLSDPNNGNNLVGVVAGRQSSVIDISAAKTTVQIGTVGLFEANVSTINGDIHKNDHITVSPIAGVGMRTVEAGKIIGTAQADFNARSSGAQSQSINDKSGRGHQIAIGQIPVLISVENWIGQPSATSGLVKNLQTVFGSVVGKQISATRAVIGTGILLAGLIIAALIVYTSVSSSIRSLGRNPLAQHSVSRTLILVVFMVIALIAITFVMSFLVLNG